MREVSGRRLFPLSPLSARNAGQRPRSAELSPSVYWFREWIHHDSLYRTELSRKPRLKQQASHGSQRHARLHRRTAYTHAPLPPASPCRSPPTIYFYALYRFSSPPILTFPDVSAATQHKPSFPFTILIENRYPFLEAAQFNQFYPQGLWQDFTFSHPFFRNLADKTLFVRHHDHSREKREQ